MQNLPKMISTKDAAYLADMFNWNIVTAYKFDNYVSMVEDESIQKELEELITMHLDFCEEIIMDALETEKNMAVNMTYALNEASHEKLYDELFNMFEEISEAAKNLYAIAYNLNYYNLEAEKAAKITNSVEKLTQELATFYSNKDSIYTKIFTHSIFPKINLCFS